MPTIEKAIEANKQRIEKYGDVHIDPPSFSAPPPPESDVMGLPVRGVLPPNLILSTDFFSSAQQFRTGPIRSSVMLPSQAVTRPRTPTSLSGKTLVAPTVGTGGQKLNRYNKVTTSITPASVAANSAATQTFTVAVVQASDKISGFQWNVAQTVGVTTLAVRVTGAGQVAVDFYNPTAGGLTPTGGSITLFLIQ